MALEPKQCALILVQWAQLAARITPIVLVVDVYFQRGGGGWVQLFAISLRMYPIGVLADKGVDMELACHFFSSLIT